MVLGRCSFNLGPLDERRTGLEVCLCVADTILIEVPLALQLERRDVSGGYLD